MFLLLYLAAMLGGVEILRDVSKVKEDGPIVVGVAGGSGSGKIFSYSARI